MSADATAVATRQLTRPEELVLMLGEEEHGYSHQVPGRDLNCGRVGAVLAELSLLVRIDTDMESLFLTGIASDPRHHSTQYRIERSAIRAESIIDLTLDRLVGLGILEHHDGELWTLVLTFLQTNWFGETGKALRVGQFIRTCIGRVIFTDEFPDPRDVMSTAAVEDYELPVGTRVYIAQTSTHWLEDVSPDPLKFDIDRICRPATNTPVRVTGLAGLARTPVSDHGGWSRSSPWMS